MWEVGGVIAVIIAIIVFFNSSSGEKALIEAHNEMARLERDYANAVDRTDGASSEAEGIRQVRDALDLFHVSLMKVDVSGCPDDYKKTFTDLINVVEDMKDALDDDDFDKCVRLNQERLSIAQQLNGNMEKHGLEILGP